MQRQDDPRASAAPLAPGAQFELWVDAGDVSGTWQQERRGSFALDDAGQFTLPGFFTLDLRLSPQRAAEAIANRLLDGYLRYPRVSLIWAGRTYTATPAIDDAVQARDRAHQAFIRYAEGRESSDPPWSRYHAWLREHRDSDALLQTTPERLWAESLRASEPTASERQFQRYMTLIEAETRAIQALPADQARQRLNGLERFQRWFEEQHDAPNFEQLDLAAELVRFREQAATSVRETALESSAAPPTIDAEAHMAHHDRFMLLAQVLRGDHPVSTYRRIIEAAEAGDVEVFEAAVGLADHPRAGPRTIPLPSEGSDILVHGDPARRMALRLLADGIMQWAGDHLQDPDYLRQDPLGVAVFLLEQEGFGELFAWANVQALDAEYIDRHEIVTDRALLAFGSTVLEGLALVALVGAAVGAGIITGGAATVLMVALAGGVGVSAYLERREQIERTHYDVPIPMTALHAVGDVAGLSQLIEGISGERLGTGELLRSVERSEQLGTGAGGVATLLLGSRAYQTGFSRGRAVRSTMGRTPAGPMGNSAIQIPDLQMPSQPVRNPSPGPNELRIRNSLAPDEQVGLDLFVQRIRGDVEAALGRMGDDIARGHARTQAERYANQIRQFEEVQAMRERVLDDPLHPRLAHNERVDGIYLHYEATPPSVDEIAQAVNLARTTGREVHLFGDTFSRQSYPGIDGTIDSPARALSLKNADPRWARTVAQDAHAGAAANGYTEVTVHIQIRGRLADAMRAWEQPSARDGTVLDALFGDRVVFEVILQGTDGIRVITPDAGRMVPPTLDRDAPDRTQSP